MVEYKSGAIGLKKGWKTIVKEGNQFRYVLAPKSDAVKLAEKIASKPPNETCLACHAFSGGGPHFKRSNLSPDLIRNVNEEFDVHMVRGLFCSDCHVFEDHKFGLNSSDTWARDSNKTVSCEDCHEKRHRVPIVGSVLNTFHQKVACQTCHIPIIAREKYPTDVRRDWSHIEFNEKLGRWEPEITLKSNVIPVYLWWNGESREAYVYPERAKVVDGKIILSKPIGSKDDEDSKIYPYKLHTAIVPFDEGRGVPVPIKVGMVFALGDYNKAINADASVSGLKFDGKYVTLVRYMAVTTEFCPRKRL